MKIIIALIAALSVGGVGGWSLGNSQPSAAEQMNNPHNRVPVATDMPLATDFISLRPALDTLPTESLSETELQGLRYMREEEKLARDVYSTLYDQWSLPIFANIAQSEQTHTEAVRDLLEKYQIADPVTDDSIGVFTNPDLQQLYTDLTASGATSVEEALRVGALIEDLDLFDLAQEIKNTNNQDIVLVYQNLMRGSRNHMRSFISQLDARGESYTPQHISQSEFDEIVASDKERGGGQTSRNGNTLGSGGGGRGWGNR